MLHTINKSAHNFGTLESALRVAQPGEPILFIEDGVQTVRSGASTEALVAEVLANHPVYALEPDIRARGIAKTVEGIKLIGYGEFVELVEQHNVVSWY